MPSDMSLLIGSKLVPESDYIRKFVNTLQIRSKASISTRPVQAVSGHNCMALYTMQLLAFCTGHRAVSDPFSDLSAFNLSAGTVLIEDKVVSEIHRARIAWISDMASSQLQRYISHLRSLSRIIRPLNEVLANQIWAVTENDYPHPIPLFFFLKDGGNGVEWFPLKPSTVGDMLGDIWILPQNTNRHILSSWLHREGCASELIDAQLGHVEAGCSPFSSRSPLAPPAAGKLIKPYLESYLMDYGWQELSGLHAPSRWPMLKPAKASKTLKLNTSFGSEVRLEARAVQWRQDGAVVLDLFMQSFPSYPPSNIPDEKVDELQETLVQQAQGAGRVLVRLVLFRLHLLRLRRNGTSTKLPGRLALARHEEGVFDIHSTTASKQAEQLRQSFLKYLSSLDLIKPVREKRLAEILVSAIVFGAQTSSRFLDELSYGSPLRVNIVQGILSVDIKGEEASPIRRWMPDIMSEALVLGYHKLRLGLDEYPLPQESIKQHLLALLQAISAPGAKSKSRKSSSISKILQPLCSLFRHSWRMQLPGVVRAYAEGEHYCASSPMSNWMRIITGKRGALPSKGSPPIRIKTFGEAISIARVPSEISNRKRAQESWSELTGCLGHSVTDSPESEENKEGIKVTRNSHVASARSNAKKRVIERKVADFMERNLIDIPPITGLVAAWILNMCRHGTAHTAMIRANSIVSYARTVGPLLIEIACEADYLALPDYEIEGIYRIVLETSPRKNRGYLAARIREFHGFLVDAYAVPRLDWSEVIDDDLMEADAVDAGIVSTNEYRRALHILLNATGSSEWDRLARASMLFFIYRFGLRIGEAFRLTISDVLLRKHEMVIYVRNSIYGETKSENGIRQIPLVGAISEDEWNLVNRWLAHGNEFAEGDALALLFPAQLKQRTAVDRSMTTRAIVEALRLVCGDNQVRLRHLRHTCATRLFLAMLYEEIPRGVAGEIYRALWEDVSPRAIRSVLVGYENVSRRGLYAMAVFMGHGSPNVTLRHYVHLADIVLRDWIRQSEVDYSDNALSYAYQTTCANIRKVRSRLARAVDSSALSDHFIRMSDAPRPELLVAEASAGHQPIFVEPANAALTISDIDRIISIATLRRVTEGLADRFLTSDDAVATTLRIASELQESTGFTDFGMARVCDLWLHNPILRRSTVEKESGRIRKFLNETGGDLQRMEVLSRMSEIWEDVYFPHSSSLLLKRRGQLVEMLDLWKKLGGVISDFEVVIPEAQSEQEHIRWNGVADEIKSMGVSVRQNIRLPHRMDRDGASSRVGLILRASDTHELGFQNSLNRVMFVVSVLKSLA